MKTLYKLIMSLTLLVFIASCEELDDKLAFSGETSAVFNESTSSALFLFTNAGQEEALDIPVSILGSAAGSDVTITFEADASSTAIEGVDYRLASTSVTIPAGSYTANISVTVLLDGFDGDPSNIKNIILNITSVQGAELATAMNQVNVAMSITCPSEIPEGTYHETATGTGGAARAVTLTALGDGRYTLSQMNFNYYNAGYDDIPGTFNDVCNSLTLEGVSTSVFGIAWIGTGTYDPVAKTLSFAVSDATYNPTAIENMVFELQ
jgi:hypothetical protein